MQKKEKKKLMAKFPGKDKTVICGHVLVYIPPIFNKQKLSMKFNIQHRIFVTPYFHT